MSSRALEFVEEWVSEKIEDMEELPSADDQAAAKKMAAQCLAAARQEGIQDTEVSEAFDDLTAFISGQIEEARTRDEEDEEDEDGEDDFDEDEDEDEDDDEEEDDEDANDDNKK